MNIKLLLDTKLTQGELAKLFGVTRVTVNHWLTGRFRPKDTSVEHVKTVAQKLTAALESGKLPLPNGIAKDRRVAVVREIIGLTD